MTEQYILSSLDHALDILGLFFEREELTASEAARLASVSRTAAYRMLCTLGARGYLARTASGGWRLGVKIFSLGALAQRRSSTSCARPWSASRRPRARRPISP